MGGVSPLSGLEPVLFRQRVHRLTVYTLFEDTSYDDLTGTDLVQDLVTTKGDLLVATDADTLARLAVGADGEIYIADASETAGLRTGTVASSVTHDALNANGDVGTGADQVAQGDHGHDLSGSLGTLTTQTASGTPSRLRVTRSAVLATAGIIGVYAYHVGEDDSNSSPFVTISAPTGGNPNRGFSFWAQSP